MSQGYIPPNQEISKIKRKLSPRVIALTEIIIGVLGFFVSKSIIIKAFSMILFGFGLRTLFKRKLKKVSPQSIKPVTPTVASAPRISPYEFVQCNLAGVTFMNGKRHRQTILRQIKWQDPPYDEKIKITLRLTEFSGEPAIEVWTNEEMVGHVPKRQVQFFVDNWDRLHDVSAFDVHGGGHTDDGEKISYGATLTTRFRTTN